MSGRLGLRKKKKGRGKTGENHDTNLILQRDVECNLAAGAVSHKVELRHGGTAGGELRKITI